MNTEDGFWYTLWILIAAFTIGFCVSEMASCSKIPNIKMSSPSGGFKVP